MLTIERDGPVTTFIRNRAEARNAMDPASAEALTDALIAFDRDPAQSVGVLWGAGGAFCAGFDLKHAATHVGHAVIESGAERGDGPSFRRRHAIDAAAPLLCLLPGSRPDGCYFHPRCRFAEDRCRREPPQLREVSPDHFARCHLAEQLSPLQCA